MTTNKGAYASFTASDTGKRHGAIDVRGIVDKLPDDEVLKALILRAVVKTTGTVKLHRVARELGLTQPPESEDAGQAYGEGPECDFSGPAELMGS